MGPVLGGDLSTSHMGMCPNGDLNALLPQGHLQMGMSFHLSKGRPLATSPKQGPPLQGDFFQDGDFCPPSHLMSPNGRHPLFPSPKWISQARTLFCPSGLSQGDISKWESSLYLFVVTPSKGIVSKRDLCSPLQGDPLYMEDSLLRRHLQMGRSFFPLQKKDLPRGDPTLKGTPPRAPLHTDLPLSLSLSPPGFLISKCCFPAVKAKPSKAKRVRTIFTSDQLARLEKEFARQQYMVGTERCLLASSLHLTEEQVSPTVVHLHLPPPADPGRVPNLGANGWDLDSVPQPGTGDLWGRNR